MARRKNDIEVIEEKILDSEYSEVMEKSYLDYSMSVIVSRALPDVRDGLKPVQRRILYDMDELGTASDRPYRKCARIVGDTMGKYHPHGDSSIYGALVNMAQDFKYSRPLVDGHGNFGSIEGDGAAAMRYTESRLQKFTEDVFLSQLKENTIDYMPNFDETEKEPVVLPCKLPNILINGSEGIAVGMATSIPTHNIAEVIDTAILFLEKPKATSEELLEVLHGPDFPTGGIISNKSELAQIYATGNGKIKVRGKIEQEQKRGEKDKLVISEIPYTMIGDGIGKFLQAVADLVENRTLPDISDIMNQSSKEGIRIVLELKKGADPEYIKAVLFKKTRLEDTFGMNLLAVDHGAPATLNLASVMKCYADFQYELNERKYHHLLEKARNKKEVDEGLIKAIDIIDVIIEILRGSRNLKQAKDCMMFGITEGINFKTKSAKKAAEQLSFTETQATTILDMRLARLIGLELEALLKDLDQVTKAIAEYEKILGSRTVMRNVIIRDLKRMKKEYGVPRKTEIIDAEAIVLKAPEEKEESVVVLIDRFGYTHAIDRSVYEKNQEAVHADFRYIIPTTTKRRIIAFTDTGKAHALKVSELPSGKLRDKGQPIDNLCNYNSNEESIVNVLELDTLQQLVFVSSDNLAKRVNMQEFDTNRKTVDATKLNDGAKVLNVFYYSEGGYVVFVTEQRFYSRMKQSEIPEKKKTAVGATATGLGKADTLEQVYPATGLEEPVPVGEAMIPLREIKPIKRGGRGKKM